MTQVTFTTIVRMVPHPRSGEIVAMDWETKEVLARSPLFATNPGVVDGNPRGGARGGRGILPAGEGLLAASYHTLHVFDRALNEIGRISNPLFVGLHELCRDEGDGSIWIAATAIDGLLKVDDEGGLLDSWWPRETPRVQRDLGLQPLEIDKSADNRTRWLDQAHARSASHCHLNAVRVHGGEVHALLNRFGVVYNVTRDRVVIHDPSIAGAHNLSFWGDRLVINDSRGRRVRIYRPDGSAERTIDLAAMAPIARILSTIRDARPQALPIFVRGLHVTADGRAFVGFSPASIAEIDLESGRLIDWAQFADDVHHTIHGLHVEEARPVRSR